MLEVTIQRHCVPVGMDGLSPLQARILHDPAPVRVFSAPTGAGKSYALFRAAQTGKRVLFIVPTRRLAQNLSEEAKKILLPRHPANESPVLLWTSDESERQRELDPNYRPGTARMRQLRQLEDGGFVIATPEAVASLLLWAPSAGLGSDPFGITDLQWFDHVVFDEFHSIDARGFGLCAVVARYCVAVPVRTQVTFLSATPVDLLPVLIALGIPIDTIAVGEETVLDSPNGTVLPNTRVLHGDVRLAFVPETDMATLLEQYRSEILNCLASGQQVVAIFDSLDELYTQKDRLAAAFDALGVPATERLAINSIDDNTHVGSFDNQFVVDRRADPLAYRVLLATSSVEMGVTFNAGLLVMDPGHDALSFVQRVGRVARRDVPGLVVVRVDPGRLGRKQWLRLMMGDLSAAPNGPAFPVARFLDIVLKAARDRFQVGGELQSDDPPRTFRSMPQRAIWAACLFWYALDRRMWRSLKGQRATLTELRPSKVSVIAVLLHHLEDDANGHAGFGRRWALAFLKQAETLREFNETVAVQEPGSTFHKAVPLRLINSRPSLAASPLVAGPGEGWILYPDRALDIALRADARVFQEERRTVLLPDGQSRSVPRLEAAEAAVGAMRILVKAPGTTSRMAAQMAAAIKLVQLSGLVPGDAELAASEGSAVL